MNQQHITQAIANESLMNQALTAGQNLNIETVLAKAALGKGLTLTEAAALLHINTEQQREALFSTAKKVKQKIYGPRIVLFAPLYLANYCVNSCAYCGYSVNNKAMPRVKLTMEQIKAETLALLKMGHKRIALEVGEDPINVPINYIIEAIKTIYSVNYNGHNLRRINVNIAATGVEEYKLLKEADIGTYILFQESYHQSTYEAMHKGPKGNFAYHTAAMHRAMTAGLDDVGLGVLYGLYDYKYETLAMLNHSNILEQDFGAGAHTISVPRLKAAKGMDLSNFPYLVNDDDFLKLIAVIRLAVPYTGLILSTRETEELRRKALQLGISQMSAASSTDVGGYSGVRERDTSQFTTSDDRTLNEVVAGLCNEGYLPSFCTACYRRERTGQSFMNMAKSGEIEKFCTSNALMTFKEYEKSFSNGLVNDNYYEKIIDTIKEEKIKEVTKKALTKIDEGEKDIYI
ncbi:MAG: [FeFe] hydrogenase H-cluster radical SAM maturase HydG [Spirochaetaceae bacterium]|nr:[FeFe] hydrogenase H-cluster radical SAM maturase HydG [Spirochaetaceae bacterium]